MPPVHHRSDLPGDKLRLCDFFLDGQIDTSLPAYRGDERIVLQGEYSRAYPIFSTSYFLYCGRPPFTRSAKAGQIAGSLALAERMPRGRIGREIVELLDMSTTICLTASRVLLS